MMEDVFAMKLSGSLPWRGRLSLSARNSSADVRRRGIPVRYRAEAAAMYWMAGAS